MRLIRLGIAPVALLGLAAVALAQDPAPPPPMPASPAPPESTAQPAQPAPMPPPVYTPLPPAPPVAPSPPPVAQVAPTPPAPPAPYRRCSSGGRGIASLGTCALRVVPGRTAQLQIKLERNLPARPAAVILIWREREESGGVIHRLTGRMLGTNPGQSAGTILTVSVADRYCAPTRRPFEVELELEGGRNIGQIGRFTFPCS